MLAKLATLLWATRRRSGGPRLWGAVPPLFALSTLALSTGGIGEFVRVEDGWWAYAVVFVLAAIPWWEVLLVVPPAIGLGLNPVLVGVCAFLGNVAPVYLIAAVHERATDWIERRRERKGEKAKRSKRASRLLERYGIGGLAMAAPVLTGVHLATVIALLLGVDPRRVVGWMTASIFVWTVALVAASVVGLDLLGMG